MNVIPKALLILTIALTLTSCQTKETSARFSKAQDNVLTCQTKALELQKAMLTKPPVMFKDERNALVYLVV